MHLHGRTHSPEVKLKVTDKHNQLGEHPIPHMDTLAVSHSHPPCGFTPAAKVVVRALEPERPEGIAPPFSPTPLH